MLKIFFAFLLVSAIKCSKLHGDQVVRVTSSREDMKRLSEHENFHRLDVWKSHPTLDIRIPASYVTEIKNFLQEHEIPHEVLIENVNELLLAEQSQHHRNTRSANEPIKLNKYLNYEETEEWISDMEREYPNLIKTEKLGESYEGRNLTAVYFNYHEGNDLVYINCGFHAREWLSPAICLATINQLVKEATINNWARVPRNISFVFIPIANPDGYAYSWSSVSFKECPSINFEEISIESIKCMEEYGLMRIYYKKRFWRKTRSKFPPSTCQGADPNRNFDIDHCGGESTSNDPCQFDLYCGPTPFSENCTSAQRDLIKRLNNVKLYIDVHSYGEYIFFPYAYKKSSSFTKRQKILEEIAHDVSQSILNATGQKYRFGNPSTFLYLASGTGLDYFFERENVPCSFAIESRGADASGDKQYGFIFPYSESHGAVHDFLVGLQTFVKAVEDGKCDHM